MSARGKHSRAPVICGEHKGIDQSPLVDRELLDSYWTVIGSRGLTASVTVISVPLFSHSSPIVTPATSMVEALVNLVNAAETGH
ncbi:hypothetical protein RRG08_041938 [Elysia crispata]|uniref:Uncharacterized protein n=1 Tax=Elysia crispata TaxID=231223 RepID=A0AAE1CNX6_9GAST|nr:hypothetical protein RRG08_041938 [Elysia crispata]